MLTSSLIDFIFLFSTETNETNSNTCEKKLVSVILITALLVCLQCQVVSFVLAVFPAHRDTTPSSWLCSSLLRKARILFTLKSVRGEFRQRKAATTSATQVLVHQLDQNPSLKGVLQPSVVIRDLFLVTDLKTA